MPLQILQRTDFEQGSKTLLREQGIIQLLIISTVSSDMSTITPHYRNVQQLLQSQSFSIDEYQREYKWEKENIDELLSDLQGKFFNYYKQGDETSAISNYGEYFLGSIIVSKRNNKNYLIDGQQRVTSLTLLLICLYRSAEEQRLPVAQTLAPLIFSDNLGKRTNGY